jgi:hypothetical protein
MNVRNGKETFQSINRLIWISKCGIVPFIKEHHSVGNFKFWPGHSDEHYSNIVVNYFEQKNTKYIKNLKIQQMFQK